jgi:LysR family nitrogen assimilation transcriptional regulator
MDLRQLQFFVRVAELGSMTKAAAALGVAQPLLSRGIRDLEADLGVKLLARNGRGVTVTEPGERFLTRARAITADLEIARDEARELRGRPGGPVSVAMAPSAGALLWVPLVTRLQDSYPEVRLKVFEGYSGDVIEWLVAGKVDVGVLYQPHLATSLKPELLIEERLYLIAAPGNFQNLTSSIEFRALGTMPLILPGKNHAIRRLLDQAAVKHQMTIDVRLEVNAYPTIKTLVMAGRGYTVLPVAPVLPEVHAGQLAILEIAHPVLSQTVGLVTSSHHQPSVAARAVCQIIRSLVEEFVNSGRWPACYGRKDAGPEVFP